mgnify:CR=1 FL=1
MEDLGLESHAVAPLNEHAWNYLQQQGVLNAGIYKNLRERMEDKDAWARKMLRSEAGLKRLATLYDDEKSSQKVPPILHKGYLDMERELIEGLSRFSRRFKEAGDNVKEFLKELERK